jgi:LmbE family N-acetylglucosaminyl deacetylase
VPFRLLGLAADPNKAGALCGQTFPRYAAAGTEITLVCAAGRGWNGPDRRPAARRWGVQDLVLLDYGLDELSADQLEAVFGDLMASVRPHVVVADATHPAVHEASAGAFDRQRRSSQGSAALPAKLYYRWSNARAVVSVTTSIAVGAGAAPELFTRAFPDPWVTGVLERDLFAGLRPELAAPERGLDSLAS